MKLVELAPELGRMVLVDLALFVLEPIGLGGESVRLVAARFGDEVDFEAGFLEGFEGVKGLSKANQFELVK